MDMNALRNYAKGINGDVKPITRNIVAKVVGVTFEGRQKLLAKVARDTEVSLERDRRNVHDPYAVKVMAKIDGSFVQVGFIPKVMAKKVSNQIDAGGSFTCKVNKLLGGGVMNNTEETLNYGLEVLVCPVGV